MAVPVASYAADPKEPGAAASGIEYGHKCEADIFYSWKRLPPKQAAAQPGQANAEQGAKGEPPGEAAPEEPIEIFVARVSERGAAEKSARDRLEKRLPAEQGKAMAACAAEHENQGQCIADRVRRVESIYKSADYLSRRVINDGIKEDCANTFGRCLSTKSGQISCEEDRPPDVAPAATPTPAPSAAAAAPAKEDPKAKKK